MLQVIHAYRFVRLCLDFQVSKFLMYFKQFMFRFPSCIQVSKFLSCSKFVFKFLSFQCALSSWSKQFVVQFPMLLVFKFLVCEVGHQIARAQVSKFMVWVCSKSLNSEWVNNNELQQLNRTCNSSKGSKNLNKTYVG